MTFVQIKRYGSTHEQSTFTFHCSNKNSTITGECTAGGMWVPDPTEFCSPALCMSPSPPTNGKIIGTTSGRFEGATLSFKCDEGFLPCDVMTATCSEGRWELEPQCEM